jgi:hypothetical protein
VEGEAFDAMTMLRLIGHEFPSPLPLVVSYQVAEAVGQRDVVGIVREIRVLPDRRKHPLHWVIESDTEDIELSHLL